eukprot:1431817-Amphidinium_carterae.2
MVGHVAMEVYTCDSRYILLAGLEVLIAGLVSGHMASVEVTNALLKHGLGDLGYYICLQADL